MSTITIEPSIKLTDMLYTTLPWLCYDLFVHDGFGDQLHLRLAEHRPHIFERLPLPMFQRFDRQQRFLEPHENPQGYFYMKKYYHSPYMHE